MPQVSKCVEKCIGKRGAFRPTSFLFGVLVIAGLAPSPAVGQESTDPLIATQDVLDDRSEAVRANDREAFLATVDPKAPSAFRGAQARYFDGLTSLPLESFALTAQIEDTGDLSAAAAGEYGGDPVFLPETRQLYRIAGYDDRDALANLWLTFVQRDDRWYVGGDDDLESLGLDTDRGLWDLGPVRLETRPRVAVISHPDQATRAAAIADLAETAMTRLAQVWDQPWSQRVPIILPSSTADLERLLLSTIDLDKFVAFASYRLSEDEDFSGSAPRILVQDSRLSRYPAQTQVETLVHELLHAAAASKAGPFVPLWVHEGVADWAATGRGGASRAPAGSDGELPRGFELSSGSQAAISRSYRESRSAIALLAERSGAGAPRAFFEALGSIRVAPGDDDYQVDVALQKVAGQGFADFERAWAARR